MAFVEGVPFAEVLKKASAAGKPIFVDMYAVWCGPCKLMDATVFADPTVTAWMSKNVIPVRFDAERGEGARLRSRYSVNSFPTFLVLDAEGNEIDRILGAFEPARFLAYLESMVSLKSSVPAAYARVTSQWDEATALSLVQTLAQRSDLPRIRPLVFRLVREDPDLAKPSTLDALSLLVALEDWKGRLSPETVDLVATYLPGLGAEPRRAMLAALLARQMVRDADAKGAKALCEETLKATGRASGFASDLETTIGGAERKLGRSREAAAAYRRALPLAETDGKPGYVRALIHLDLADTLATLGDSAGARAEMAKSDALVGRVASVLSRQARILVRLKETPLALETARHAVELSGGGDPDAEAALGAALLASGDRKGAAQALARAVALDPSNAELKKELAEAKAAERKGAPSASRAGIAPR